MRRMALLMVLFTLVESASLAQTTQGLIAGRILDSFSGRPVGSALVSFVTLDTSASGSARSNSSGYYVIPLLSPGHYQLRVTADRYQSQEIYELELRVAARLDVSFRLRAVSDGWDARRYRSFLR